MDVEHLEDRLSLLRIKVHARGGMHARLEGGGELRDLHVQLLQIVYAHVVHLHVGASYSPVFGEPIVRGSQSVDDATGDVCEYAIPRNSETKMCS